MEFLIEFSQTTDVKKTTICFPYAFYNNYLVAFAKKRNIKVKWLVFL